MIKFKTITVSAPSERQLDEKINNYTRQYNVVDIKFSTLYIDEGSSYKIKFSAMLIIKQRWWENYVNL